MTTKTTSEVIKELVQQINLKEISTKDFVSEMKGLYEKIEEKEFNLERLEKESDEKYKHITKLEKKIEDYEKDFVIPANEYFNKEEKLDKKHQDWQLEKKYVARENEILREVLGNVVAIRNVNTYDGHGASYNENFVKPNLSPLEKPTEDKKDEVPF